MTWATYGSISPASRGRQSDFSAASSLVVFAGLFGPLDPCACLSPFPIRTANAGPKDDRAGLRSGPGHAPGKGMAGLNNRGFRVAVGWFWINATISLERVSILPG